MASKSSVTITKVLDHPLMKKIMDRSVDILDVCDEVAKWWSVDLYSRNPAPAVMQGEFQGTDLDLSTFLAALAERHAVINIPTYKSMRESTRREGQVIVSKDNRHGQIVGLTANQDVFTFGLKIKDANVMSNEGVGDFRNFNLTNLGGQWYDGWKTIQFIPTAKENDFLNDKKLWTNSSVVFKYFVSSARWQGLFGGHYFLTKALIMRLEEEARYLKGIADIIAARYPDRVPESKWGETVRSGESKPVKVKSMQVEVDFPIFSGEYPKIDIDTASYTEVTERRNKLVYTIKPRLTFGSRGTELAFFQYATPTKVALWLPDTSWSLDQLGPDTVKITDNSIKKAQKAGVPEDAVAAMKLFKEHRRWNSVTDAATSLSDYVGSADVDKVVSCLSTGAGRTKWDQLVMPNGLVLRKRVYEKTERVDPDYVESAAA